MKSVFVYNVFGIEKYPFWKGILCLDENYFERFIFYTILGKKKLTEMDELSVGFKTFEMEMNEMSVYLQYNRKMSILEGHKCK